MFLSVNESWHIAQHKDKHSFAKSHWLFYNTGTLYENSAVENQGICEKEVLVWKPHVRFSKFNEKWLT